MNARLPVAAAVVFLSSSIGCVTSGTHQAVVDQLTRTRGELDDTKKSLDAEKTKNKEIDDKLTVALDQNQQLVTKISAMGQNVEQLLGEKDSLAQQRAQLDKEVEELKRMRAAAEARNAEYRSVLEKLRHMIDAGTLQVKFRGGRMLVQMSSDVVFPPGGIRIKPAAREAIIELAQTIKQFPDRKFQVIGHSDATPIHTERFPSNWELSSQRAIEVVQLMVEAGVPPEMLSAAGNAEFDPVAANDSPENQAANRRVEVVFLPKLDELPGFDTVLSDKK